MPTTVDKQTLEAEQGMPRDSRPVPDPTALTTAQLRRELLSLRELIEAELKSLDGRIEANLRLLDKQSIELDIRVNHLRDLHDEKFKSIDKQFTERDTRTEQTSRDSKVAVDAALQAAKEAVGEQNRSSALAIAKSEAATMKQIDQMGVLIQTNTSATDGKITDLKERMSLMDGRSRGIGDIIGWIVGVAGLGVAIITVILRSAK